MIWTKGIIRKVERGIRGHSSLKQTLDFGALTEAKELVPFHHDPDHTDTDLPCLIAEAMDEARPAYRVTPGIEGTSFEL